jgi:hypothetical protein
MIPYLPPLKAVGGARTGVAPVNLLDVQDVNGNIYYWADRPIYAPNAIDGGITPYALLVPPVLPVPSGQNVAWSIPTSVAVSQGSPVGSGVEASASATLTEGVLLGFFGNPLGTGAGIVWSGFAMPTLPPGAVIDAIYVTAVMKRGAGDSAITGPFSAFPAPGDEGQFSGLIGPATEATVLAATISVGMYATVGGPAPDELDITDPAIAIYYHVPGQSGASGGYFSPGVAPYGSGPYQPWLLSVPKLTFHRSSQTDVGNFILQNLSGDSISRDFEKIMRRSALEGAYFVYRCWQPDAQASWIEAQGTLTVDDVGVDTVTLKGAPAINPAQDDTPAEEYSETCQWRWSSPQCGATGATECQYSYQTCQVIERIFVVLNDFEKNYGETTANTPLQVINRRRKF